MPSRRMKSALTIVAIVGVVYVGILVMLWRFQERIVFQPPANPDAVHTGTSTIAYTSGDGIRLVAYVVESRTNGAPVILAFHGNAMIARWMIPWAQEVSRRVGATVVLPEYRGYDGLAGVPTYPGAAADAAAALEATTARFGLRPDQLIFYGHSLGTAIATELATAQAPRALLLESPFTSAREMAPPVGVGFFWGLISRVHYDTRRHVAQLDVPVHVVHGERDMIVPMKMGRAVHAAARRPGQLLVIPDAGHNDVAIAGGEGYWRWIGEAIAAGGR